MNFTKMMSARLLIICLLISFSGVSQSRLANGIIYDELTKEAIPYVNLSIIDSKIGTSSAEDGSYSLSIGEEYLQEKIYLSCLGYNDSVISIESFLKKDVIYLNPQKKEIAIVKAVDKIQTDYKTVNPIKSREVDGAFSPSEKPLLLALYFPFNKKYKKNLYLNSLKVYLYKNSERASKFRVRLFSVDKTGLPNIDLINQNIIVETSKNQTEVVVGISEFNIKFPEEGIYIGLESLSIPFNKYEKEIFKRNSDGTKRIESYVSHSPQFGTIKERVNKVKFYSFSDGNWINTANRLPKQFNSDGKVLIPAISLTLSN